MHRGNRYVKGAVLAAIILLTALTQNSFLPAFGARHTAWLLTALITAVAMHEPELNAAGYALLAGVLWDVTSPLPDGTITLFLTVCACACSLLARCLFRRTMLTAIVFCVGCNTLFCILTLAFQYAVKDFSALPGVVLQRFLPSFLLTVPALPAFYLLIRAIEKHLSVKAGTTI